MSNPENIYLQPECCADPDIGRVWCEHDSPEDCEDGKPWAHYVIAQRWIPVSEEPESNIGDSKYFTTRYLVLVDGEVTTRYWREGQTAMYWASWSDERVTHWRPLPTPPEQEH